MASSSALEETSTISEAPTYTIAVSKHLALNEKLVDMPDGIAGVGTLLIEARTQRRSDRKDCTKAARQLS